MRQLVEFAGITLRQVDPVRSTGRSGRTSGKGSRTQASNSSSEQEFTPEHKDVWTRLPCAAVQRNMIDGVGRMDLQIRQMTPADMALAVDWAAAEGWNPGHADAVCFATVDPAGFLVGEIDGEPVAIISNVNHSTDFAFLGFYIVRPDRRGRGYGLAIWRAAIEHAGNRIIGLDGVLAQQENYRKSGFVLSHRNVRFGGMVDARHHESEAIALADVPFALVEADDATVFPAPRRAFLRAWIGAPGHRGRALVRAGRLAAWGVIRPCRRGFKIGPMVADDRACADIVFDALIADTGGGEVFLDVPEPNREAIALAHARGLVPVFETARMYTGPVRPLRLDRVFGIATVELG